jgi:hypothetical protein
MRLVMLQNIFSPSVFQGGVCVDFVSLPGQAESALILDYGIKSRWQV